MTYTTIMLARGRNEDTPAQAIRCGRFAVHASDGSPLKLWPKDAWYVVSHVATGYMLCALPGRDKARALAGAFDKALRTPDITRPDFDGAWPAHSPAFIARAPRTPKAPGPARRNALLLPP